MTRVDAQEYRRRIRAWTLYDWANSAFATTILAAVLPVYYARVAASTLPSAEVAAGYWTMGLSLSLFVVAVLSPILGTISDVVRGKKRFLAVTAGVGIVATGSLVLVGTGDWILASILFIVGRVGFASANVFYDALLPHVAREKDRDRVSTRGYAVGYLGGGLLLAIDVVLIQCLPGTWGFRLSFLSVALWWALFSIPLLRRVPEPPAAPVTSGERASSVRTGFRRLRATFRRLREFRELSKFLVAFLIYNDGIGTIIAVAAIYATTLGLGAMEVILALLLVQFVGVPYCLLFGRIPSPDERRRPLYLAFVLFQVVALPLVGLVGAGLLPEDVTGRRPASFVATGTTAGEGVHRVGEGVLDLEGGWRRVPRADLGHGAAADHAFAEAPGARVVLRFHGRRVLVRHSLGPDHGLWAVEVDGQPLLDSGDPLRIDAWHPTPRYGETTPIDVGEGGEHVLALVSTGEGRAGSRGTRLGIADVEVLPPARRSHLGMILGLLVVLQIVGAAFALVLGPRLFARIAARMDTKRTLLLALAVYAGIATWGYVLDSVFEFWFLAWMVAVVQGGSQALSRSLYARLSPASMSGEFFGFFSVMAKFSAILGPILFTVAIVLFHSTRPAVLSVVLFFVVGAFLLRRVDTEEGTRVARKADAAAGMGG